MLKQCIQCKKDFEAKRNDAKFCSSTCRSVAKRNATDNSATDNATVKLDIATDKKCGCVPTEMKKCIHRGCTELHQFYECIKWGEHIENYCKAMCQ